MLGYKQPFFILVLIVKSIYWVSNSGQIQKLNLTQKKQKKVKFASKRYSDE